MITILTVLMLNLFGPMADAGADVSPPPPSLALFDGALIDLTEGWAGATACAVMTDVTECFRSEAELDEYLSTHAEFLASSCSTALRLYTGTSFSGSTLALTARQVHNLSSYGFDNATSSYKVGACASTLYDGTSASGTVYPGATGAGAQASAMQSGWDNRVSSARVN